MGFAWWVVAVGSRSVGFIGCGIGFCCHVRAVSGWERGFACMESGVFEVGLFRFRLKKKGGTSHDVPMLKKILVDFRLDLPFCILSFDVFAMQR